MKQFKWVVLVLVAMLVAGCGGGAGHSAGSAGAKAPAESSAPEYSYNAAGEEQAFADGDGAGASSYPQSAMPAPAQPGMAPPAPPAADGDAEYSANETPAAGAAPRSEAYRSRPPAKQERPGLATRWGEYRESHVSTTPFVRADPSQPFATAQIYYNDRDGVRAMAARSGISDFGDNLARAAQSQLSVRILDGSGRALYGTRAGGRSYVVGQHGQRYIIQIRNHTGNRVEAVATVDGLDVIDGRPGAFSKRGYLINPFSTVEIEGFRRSSNAVATFRFGSVSDSYAARKGNARNVGVIGVAFFHEEGSRWPWTNQEVDRRHDADPFPGRYADPPPQW